MRKAFCLILVLFLASSATSTSIESENVTVDLQTKHVEVDTYVKELTSSAFTYITSYPVDNVEATANGESLNCETSYLQVGTEITCDTELRSNFTVEIEFKEDGLTSIRNNAEIFSYAQSIYRPTENYNLRVLLPSGSGLIDQNNASTPVVSPLNYDVGSNGQQIFVEWNSKPQIGETLRFSLMYETLSSNNRYIKSAGSIVGLLGLASIGYIVWRRKTRDNINEIYEDLSEDEIDILELLIEEDGEMLQKDVVNSSKYSKAKISGLVSSLVDKEVITKQKEGRSNKLTISKKYTH